jgi:outer membrane receptor for ferrienterochelin and colicin
MEVPYTPRLGTTNPLVIRDAVAVLTSENGGEVRAYGGELAVTAELGDWLRPWGSYSLVLGSQVERPTARFTSNTDYLLNTDYLTNQASHQIKGGLQIQPLKGLFLVPTAVWYGRTRIRPDAGNDMNPVDLQLRADGLDPFFLLNLSVVWESGDFQLWARVHNLLDRQYYRPGGPVSQQAAPRVPQAGVLGQAGIRISY